MGDGRTCVTPHNIGPRVSITAGAAPDARRAPHRAPPPARRQHPHNHRNTPATCEQPQPLRRTVAVAH